MKHYNKYLLMSVFALTLMSSTVVFSQGLTLPRAASPAASVTQQVGITDITINYSRPSVNDREIWGALVPYGLNNLGFGTATAAPWRAGANENTTIEFSHDVTIDGKELSAGIYGLFIEVKDGEDATLILSNNSSSWGSFFYNETEDAARIDIKTEEVSHTEMLTFEFTSVDATTATIVLKWEKLSFLFAVEVNVPEIVMASIRNELRTSPGFNPANWNAAANYAMNNSDDMEEALAWADASISAPFIGQKNFANLQTKAAILSKMENQTESEKTMDEAMPLGTIFQVHQYGRTLIAQGNKEKALEVFKWNAKNSKNTWPVNYGLARGYSATGDYKTALKYLEAALENAPNEGSKGRVSDNIEKLKKNEDIN